MAGDERIGGVSIGVEADFSDLDRQFQEAVSKAVANGATLAEAIEKALSAPSAAPLTNALDSVGQSLGKAADEANKAAPAIGGLQQGFQQAGTAAQGASEGVGSFAGELLKLGGLSLTIDGLFNLGKAAIQASDQIDDAKFALEKLTGSAEASQKTMEGLRALSNDEGLSFPVLVDASQRLTALLPAGTDVVGVLEHIGNAAELMHVSIETASNKFARLAESGSASVKSLADLGIRLEDLEGAMRTLGVSSDLLAEGAQKAFKALDEHDRIIVLQQAMERLDGAAKQMNDDIGGDSVRLMNQWNDTLAKMGDTIAPVARQALPALSEALKGVVSAVAFLVSGMSVSMDAIVGFGSGLQSIIGGIGGAIAQLSKGNFSEAINSLKGGLSDAATANAHALDQMKADIKSGADFINKIYATDVPASVKHTADSLDGLGKNAKDASDKVGASFEAAGKAVDAFDAKVQAGGSSSVLQRAFENASKSIDILAKQDLPAAIKAVDDYTAAQERNGAKASVIMEAFEKESALIKKLANEDLPAASAAELKLIETLGQGATPLGVWQKALSDEEAILNKLAKDDLSAAEAGWNRLIAALEKAKAPASVIAEALKDHTEWLEKSAAAADKAQAAFIKLAQSYSDVNTKGHDAAQTFKDAEATLDRLGITAAKLPTPISESNKAMIVFGENAGKAKTAVENLKTPLDTLIDALGTRLNDALKSGDWSGVLQDLDAFDKRIQNISKTDLPEAVREMQAWVDKLQASGAPIEIVQGQMEILGRLVEKMGKEGYPGAKQALDAYLESLKKVPSAIQDIQHAQEMQLDKEKALLDFMKQRGDAEGYLMDQEKKELELAVQIATKRGEDASKFIYNLEAIKLKQEVLNDQTGGLARTYVSMFEDINKGFDQMAGAMAGAIVDGKNLGDALIGVFKNIAKSILTDLIQGALMPLRDELKKMESDFLKSLGGGAAGGAAGAAGAAIPTGIPTGGDDAFPAGTAGGGSGSGGGGGGGGIMSGGAGLAIGIVQAGAMVACAVLLGHISSDTGHIEVNTREAEAELRNIRADDWEQYGQMYLRLGECKNALDSISDSIKQLNIASGGFPEQAMTDLNDIAAMAKVAYPIFPALLGALGTVAQDIVTWDGYILEQLYVVVQKLGQIATHQLTGSSDMEAASAADVAAAASEVADAVSDASGQADSVASDIIDALGSSADQASDSANDVVVAIADSATEVGGQIESTSGDIVNAVSAAGAAVAAQVTASSDGLARTYKDSSGSKDVVSAVNNAREATTEALLKQLAAAQKIAESGGSTVEQMKALQDELNTYQKLIEQAVRDGNQRLADGYKQAADNARSQLEAMAHSGAVMAEHIAALQAEIKYDNELMERAIRDGNLELADRYRQAAANVQSELLPLLSATATYTRDAALAEGQLASTLPKEIAGVGFAATGAGNLVAAHVDAAAVTIGTAVIAQGAFMQAAANALLSAAASMGHAGSGSVYGGGPGGSSGTPTTGPGSPGYGQSQLPAGPTTSTGGFGGTVNKPSTNAPGTPSSNTPGQTTPYRGSTGAYVSDPNAIPMFQTGGMVTQSGMAIVEADEIVIPPAKKGDTFDQISGNNTKSDQQMAYEKLVDQVQSQMAWIAQAIGNHAPPAMMDILNKQLETYQKALLQFEMQTKLAQEGRPALPDLHPQPAGTKGTPLVDPATVVGTPEWMAARAAAGNATIANDPNVFGTPAWIAAHANATKVDPATIFGTPEWIKAHQAAPGAVDPATIFGSLEWIKAHQGTAPAPTTTTTTHPGAPTVSTGSITTQQFYHRALADLDGLLAAASAAPSGVAAGGTSAADTTSPVIATMTKLALVQDQIAKLGDQITADIKAGDLAKADAEAVQAAALQHEIPILEQIANTQAALVVAQRDGQADTAKKLQSQLDALQRQLTVAETAASGTSIPKPTELPPLKGGPIQGPAVNIPVTPDPALIFGSPEWIAAQMAKGNATVADNPAVFGTPAWIKQHANPNQVDPSTIFGTPEWITAHMGGTPTAASGPKSPTDASVFGSPAWIQAQQAAGQAATAASNIPTVGLPSGPTLDSQTLGFYAATDAELEDIRNTLHINTQLISSMRDSWVAFQVTSHNDSMIVGQAIIDAIGGKEAKPMKSFDLGGSVGMDMIAQLHAGEEVLAPDISSTLRKMLSTPSGVFTHPNPAEGTRGGVRIINITAPITINGAKGGRANAEEFVEHLKRIVPDSNGYSS